MGELEDLVREQNAILKSIFSQLVEIRIQSSPPTQPNFIDLLVNSQNEFTQYHTFESDTKFWQMINTGPSPILYAYENALNSNKFFWLGPGGVVSQNTRPKHLFCRLAPGFDPPSTLKLESWNYSQEDLADRSKLGEIFKRGGFR